jgi:hypothetical protein
MSIRTEVLGVLPLAIKDVEINSPFFNVYGDRWNLSVDCNWTLAAEGGGSATWESDDDTLTTALQALKGRSIVDVEIDDALFNPTFRFDDGATLLIDADTDLDPWVFRADGLSTVLVGYGPEGHSQWVQSRRESDGQSDGRDRESEG